jgi:hypothetical protein
MLGLLLPIPKIPTLRLLHREVLVALVHDDKPKNTESI